MICGRYQSTFSIDKYFRCLTKDVAKRCWSVDDCKEIGDTEQPCQLVVTGNKHFLIWNGLSTVILMMKMLVIWMLFGDFFCSKIDF